MLAGDAFTAGQREEITRAIERGRAQSGLSFSVYVGAADGDPREYARKRHAELGPAAPDSVLIFVDPAARELEIVTGGRCRRWLDDRSCVFGAMTMSSAFAAGDLAGGIAQGVAVLAEHARHSDSLHRDWT